MLDTLQEIAGSLRRNMMRTIATGFAVASGLFLIIVLQGAGNGIINSFETNMSDFAFDAIHIFGGMTTKPFEGMKEGRFIRLDNRDLEMSKRTFAKNVSNVIPGIGMTISSVNNGENYLVNVSMKGIYPEYATSQAVKLLEGRFVNEVDLAQQRKVLVIGRRSADDLFGKGSHPTGKFVNVGGIAYQVVGIYKTNEMFDSDEFYTPFTTLAVIYNKGKFLDELTMNVHGIESDSAMDVFMDEYIRASSHIHSFAPDDKRALWIWNQAGDNIQMNKAKNILHTSFWILGMLTLISGVVGVSNIMLISVKERTREFGIRRAIGARPWAIIRMVMMESVVITAVFGYFGMLLGVFFCEWMDASVGNQTMDMGVFKAQYFVNPTVDLSVCMTATVIIIVAGALAGFFPARRAVKVKPIDALRG